MEANNIGTTMKIKNNRKNEKGFTLAALLVLLFIMSVMWALVLPVWTSMNKREKELEMIWRGEQIQKAIGRYYYKFGAYPVTMEMLVQKKFLRKPYKDPLWPNGEWEILYQVTQERNKQGVYETKYGPIIGVTSKSQAGSIIWYQKQRQHNKWRFIFYPQGAMPAQQVPGQSMPEKPSQPAPPPRK